MRDRAAGCGGVPIGSGRPGLDCSMCTTGALLATTYKVSALIMCIEPLSSPRYPHRYRYPPCGDGFNRTQMQPFKCISVCITFALATTVDTTTHCWSMHPKKRAWTLFPSRVCARSRLAFMCSVGPTAVGRSFPAMRGGVRFLKSEESFCHNRLKDCGPMGCKETSTDAARL